MRTILVGTLILLSVLTLAPPSSGQPFVQFFANTVATKKVNPSGLSASGSRTFGGFTWNSFSGVTLLGVPQCVGASNNSSRVVGTGPVAVGQAQGPGTSNFNGFMARLNPTLIGLLERLEEQAEQVQILHQTCRASPERRDLISA